MNTVTRSGDTLSTVQLMRHAGITYRQAYHWQAKGYLVPQPRPENASSGSPMRWTLEEADIARRIGELTRIGLAVQVAALYARQAPAEADKLLELTREMPQP
jgi:hypothetical protein